MNLNIWSLCDEITNRPVKVTFFYCFLSASTTCRGLIIPGGGKTKTLVHWNIWQEYAKVNFS